MSDASDAALLTLLMADFVNTDAAGKTNVVGGGINALAQLRTGTTPPFWVWARAEVPNRVCPVESVLEIALLDSSGQVYQPEGQDRPFRLAQVTTFERARAGASFGPPEMTWGSQMVLGFPNGLPLPAGGHFKWSFRVDGDDEHARVLDFAVMRDQQLPVFG